MNLGLSITFCACVCALICNKTFIVTMTSKSSENKRLKFRKAFFPRLPSINTIAKKIIIAYSFNMKCSTILWLRHLVNLKTELKPLQSTTIQPKILMISKNCIHNCIYLYITYISKRQCLLKTCYIFVRWKFIDLYLNCSIGYKCNSLSP